MGNIRKLLSVLLVGNDVMRFQKVYSYYMGLENHSLGLLTRSGFLKQLINEKYEQLLEEDKISPVKD